MVSWTPTWLDPESPGPPGATTAVGTTAVVGCRCGANECTASGYEKPHCWGVLACGTTSERPLWGYSKRATLGGCSAGIVPRSARRLGASLLGCLWRVVHWVGGFMAHCRFPGSGSISPPCVVNERAVQVLSTPRRDSGWKRTCNMCGCRCPVPCRCAIALQGTAPR